LKLHDYFAGLLTDTVNLKEYRLVQLADRVGAITRSLQNDSIIGDLYQDHIPQGSWPHRTIINPLPSKEFDGDFLLLLSVVPDWGNDPKEYLKQVRAAFKRSSTYKDKVRKKNRCIRIGYSGDCHIDVVPHLRLAGGRQVIVNYAENKFEDTNPEGFTSWMQEKDSLANGHLRRVLRLLKYLRDYKSTFSVPSVILTTLLGERVQAWDAANRYADLPTAFVALLTDLDLYLKMHPGMPVLADPSCPGTTFNHRWDETRYANFAKWIAHYRSKAQAALDETDKDTSTALWREIFGNAFQKSAAPVAAELAAVAKTAERPVRAPAEEFIEDRGFVLRPTHTARIIATVHDQNGFRAGTPLRYLRHTSKRLKIEFRVDTDFPEPFDLYWKIRNTGPEAEAKGDLRGQIIRDGGQRKHRENTKYRGTHYVEVYVVSGGVVVATDHHDVPIA
jgi:hypothetical protein